MQIWPNALILPEGDCSREPVKSLDSFLDSQIKDWHCFDNSSTILSLYVSQRTQGLVAEGPSWQEGYKGHLNCSCAEDPLYFLSTELNVPPPFAYNQHFLVCVIWGLPFSAKPRKNESTLVKMWFCDQYLLGGQDLACFIYVSPASNMKLGTRQEMSADQ